MHQLSRLSVVSAFVAALAACPGPGDIDRTQPEKVKKDIFFNDDGTPAEFFFRQTVIDRSKTRIFALINVVGVEFLINYGGLGQLINELAERYDLAGTYAAICFVILVSVLFFITLETVERGLRPVD